MNKEIPCDLFFMGASLFDLSVNRINFCLTIQKYMF